MPLLLAALAAGPSALRAQTSDSITAADVRRRIALLASDSLRGRGTPSPGLEQAARYAAREFQRLGLRPAGDSGYIQRYALDREHRRAAAASLAGGARRVLAALERHGAARPDGTPGGAGGCAVRLAARL